MYLLRPAIIARTHPLCDLSVPRSPSVAMQLTARQCQPVCSRPVLPPVAHPVPLVPCIIQNMLQHQNHMHNLTKPQHKIPVSHIW
eukprot:scaffold262097_cov28-Tisochrysis_lutea.AAC.1